MTANQKTFVIILAIIVGGFLVLRFLGKRGMVGRGPGPSVGDGFADGFGAGFGGGVGGAGRDISAPINDSSGPTNGPGVFEPIEDIVASTTRRVDDSIRDVFGPVTSSQVTPDIKDRLLNAGSDGLSAGGMDGGLTNNADAFLSDLRMPSIDEDDAPSGSNVPLKNNPAGAFPGF